MHGSLIVAAANTGTTTTLGQVTGWLTLILGAAAIAAGLYVAVQQTQSKTRQRPKPHEEDDDKRIINPIHDGAELATGLAKLDPATRLLVVGVVLIAISGVTAGLGEISSGLAKHGGGKSVTIINKPTSGTHTKSTTK